MFYCRSITSIGTRDDQRGDEIKEGGEKKKDTGLTFRRMETTLFESNGDRDDRLFRRFFHHRLVIVTATIILLRVRHRNDEQPLLRLSHIYIYIFFSLRSPNIFIFRFWDACRTMYSRCQR